MSSDVPEFQSFFLWLFSHYILLVKLTTSSTRVEVRNTLRYQDILYDNFESYQNFKHKFPHLFDIDVVLKIIRIHSKH